LHVYTVNFFYTKMAGNVPGIGAWSNIRIRLRQSIPKITKSLIASPRRTPARRIDVENQCLINYKTVCGELNRHFCQTAVSGSLLIISHMTFGIYSFNY